MIRRLAHLCLHTDDLERQIRFYRDGLGLPVKFRFVAADGAVFGAYVSTGDSTFVEFFDRRLAARQWGDGSEPEPLMDGNRYAHFCLEVVGLKELRQVLLKRGVEVGELREGLDGSLQAWLRDPDGNRLEIMEYTHRSAQLAAGEDGVVRGLK